MYILGQTFVRMSECLGALKWMCMIWCVYICLYTEGKGGVSRRGVLWFISTAVSDSGNYKMCFSCERKLAADSVVCSFVWGFRCVTKYDISTSWHGSVRVQHNCTLLICVISTSYLFDLLHPSAMLCLIGHTTSLPIVCLQSICVSPIVRLLYTVYVPPQPWSGSRPRGLREEVL